MIQWFFSRSIFQSTLPAKGETIFRITSSPRRRNFNPLSQRRERRTLVKKVDRFTVFQSTLPAKGETIRKLYRRGWFRISIHSPSEGRDPAASATSETSEDFNPLSQRRERQRWQRISYSTDVFQSTLPAKGETTRLG